MTDTRFIFLEQEELVENHEIEREELKEGKEGRDWIKILLSGGADYLNAQNTLQLQRTFQFCLKEIKQQKVSVHNTDIPFFIKYCCLKIHVA